jgi:hypothetical protein
LQVLLVAKLPAAVLKMGAAKSPFTLDINLQNISQNQDSQFWKALN